MDVSRYYWRNELRDVNGIYALWVIIPVLNAQRRKVNLLPAYDENFDLRT